MPSKRKPASEFWQDRAVLVRSGTRSFGKKSTHVLLRHHPVKKLTISRRDELTQHEVGVGAYSNLCLPIGNMQS